MRGTIAQIPGVTYDGNVLDEAGNSLRAGFFFLDGDGRQISQTWVISDGLFHFTIPDHNHENIFLQFYSTEEYEPVVKRFSELVDDDGNMFPVVLKKKTSTQREGGGVMVLAAVAVVVFFLIKEKK